MHSSLSRLNALSAYASSALCLLLLLATAQTYWSIPRSLIDTPARSTASGINALTVPTVDVILGRSSPHHQPSRHGSQQQREFAFAKFDADVDLDPLFGWNTKQVFLYLVAEYPTSTHPSNEVVIWDRIVRRKQDAHVAVSAAKQKYAFKEIGNSFRNVTASFALKYSVTPRVGMLVDGVAARTREPVVFPPRERRSV